MGKGTKNIGKPIALWILTHRVSFCKAMGLYSFLKFYLYNPSLDSRCSKLATPSVTIAITVAACS